jgi:hypothetical protein
LFNNRASDQNRLADQSLLPRQAFSAFCGLKVVRSDARNLCRSAVASFEERLRISQGSSVGFIEEGSRINAALQMNELRYVKLRIATPRIWAVRSEKGVGGKDRQTSAGIGWLDLITIRADKASHKKYHNK